MTSRSLVLAPLTVLAIAALAGPALAGTDGDDAGGGPVITPAPVPFVQPPAPVPVVAATPAPPPPELAPETSAPAERVRKGTRHRRTRPAATAHRKAPHRATRTQLVRATTFPRGGVQAGAGGTAP